MTSAIRILTLGLFAAIGIGIAAYVATSTDFGPAQSAADSANSTPPVEQRPSAATTEERLADVLPRSSARLVPPHREYAQQFSDNSSFADLLRAGAGAGADPNAAPTGAMPTLDQVNQIGKMLLDSANARKAETEQLQNELRTQLGGQQQQPPSRNAASSAPTPANPRGDEEDEEGEGDEMATSPAPPGAAGSLPSSIKITHVPGEGDDRLSVHIQNKDLRQVLDFLGEHGGLSILASSNVQGLVTVSLTDVTIDEALQAVLKSTGYVARHEGKFIYVGTPKDLIATAQSVDRIRTRVYRPNYVKASELQPLIMPLLTSGVGSASTGASMGGGGAGMSAGGMSGGGMSGGGMASVGVSPPAQTGISADSSQAGGDTFAQGEVLVVRDYEAVLAEIDQVIAEVDKRPLQVAIESMLLSIELKDTNSFGVDFNFLREQQNVLLATGSPVTTLSDVSLTDGGLKFGFLDSSLGSFIAALQTIGDTNVLATPRLTCLNKHKAEILIGQQLGYVTKTLTQTTTAQSVEFLEVGTQLRLRPFISTDGLIRMEVHPEISTGSVDVTDGFTLPNKTVTQVTTNIMVRDGCTVVIGGLMQESLANSGSQVPFIGSAPGVGFLFRSRKGQQTRNEIIVLITPHIMYEPEASIEGEKAACDFHRQHAVYKDEMAPLNSRSAGRRFYRLAQKAWAENNKAAAMRYINLSIHFDPSNRASVDLRSDIMAGNHYGAHTLSGPPPQAPPAEAVDGQAIAPWVLNDLEQEADPAYMPAHPRDPGQPTRSLKVQPTSKFR